MALFRQNSILLPNLHYLKLGGNFLFICRNPEVLECWEFHSAKYTSFIILTYLHRLLPTKSFFSLFFWLLKTHPITLYPNIFLVLACVKFMHVVEGIDICREYLLFLLWVKSQKGASKVSVTKYLTSNPNLDSSLRGIFYISFYSFEKNWA